MSCPIPIDLHIQRFWRDHDVVTDEMVQWLKEQANCEPFERLLDLDERRHIIIFDKKIPPNKLAWLKIDTRNGATNIYCNQTFYTDYNGRNLVASFDYLKNQ